MHTLVSKIVALSDEKYMVLTEIQLKIRRFHGSLSQKGSRPLAQVTDFFHATRSCAIFLTVVAFSKRVWDYSEQRTKERSCVCKQN